MHRIKVTLLSFLSLFTILFAVEVTQDIAQQTAENIYFELTELNRTDFYVTDCISEKGDMEVLIFIFNFYPSGFVMVAAEDQVFPVLGYSFEQIYSQENHPIQFDAMMNSFKEQIIYARGNNLSATKEIENRWQRLSKAPEDFEKLRNIRNVSPLISTNWDQDYPWNQYCPYDPAGPGNHAYAGCVAVSMAQVMKYWSHPDQGTGSHSYYHSNYGWISADFGATTYDWSNMPNNYATDATKTLLFHCGVAVEMDYGPYGSGAWVGQYYPSALSSLETYFGYDLSANFKLKSSYSTSVWESMLRTELDNGRPLIYRGYDSGGSSGHAFNIDGYQGTNYFHLNWGWSGYYNGYYYISNLNPGGYNFSYNQGGVFNLFPIIEDVSLTMTPLNPPIQIPQNGGSFDFNVTLTNNLDSGVSFFGEIMVELPNGNSYGPVLGPVSVNLLPNSTISMMLSQDVPASAPTGVYTYIGSLGYSPSNIIDTDSFTFTKLGYRQGSGLDWGWLGHYTDIGIEVAENDLWTVDGIFSKDGSIIYRSGESMATDESSIPESFALYQNYPNPFNPVTTIRYELPEKSYVTIVIYDIMGREVKELVRPRRAYGEPGELVSGYHKAVWDGTDSFGKPMGAGVYLYQIRAKGFTQTRKMLLLK